MYIYFQCLLFFLIICFYNFCCRLECSFFFLIFIHWFLWVSFYILKYVCSEVVISLLLKMCLHNFFFTLINRYALTDLLETEREYIKELKQLLDNFYDQMNRPDVPACLKDKKDVIFGISNKFMIFTMSEYVFLILCMYSFFFLEIVKSL